MKISRRTLLARAAALAIVTGPEEVKAAANPTVRLAPVKLHGYGTISAAFRTTDGGRSSVTQITCESAQKGLLVQAKYLSDLGRLPGLEAVGVAHGGGSIPCFHWPAGGAVACMAHGSEVLILAAADLPSLRKALTETAGNAADFTARAAVPMWLDRWDKHGLLCYMAPDATPPGTNDQDQTYDYADALKFAASHGNLGLVVWTNPLVDDHSEGLTNEPSWGWVQEGARRMGLPMHINTQISYPQLWLGNRFREQTMLKAPQFLGGYYGVGHDSAGVGAISWLSREAEDMQLALFQRIVRRHAKEPNIVGWLEPHGETGETPQKFFLDSGPYADGVFRSFMQVRCGTLQALSERWHGDPSHYRSWSDVHIPEVAEFAGFGPDAIDLRGTWRVRYAPAPDGHAYSRDEARGLPSPPPTAPVPTEWYAPGFADGEWDELIAPGNDRMLTMVRSPLIYRRTIQIPADWLSANPHVTLAIWDLVNSDRDVTSVYVNGEAVSEVAHRSRDQHWSQFDVTHALRPGPNLLAINMPRGIICYRAYLSKEAPAQYPRLGPHRNARWVDFVEFIIESRGAQIRRGAEMIRQVDPNSSINLMAPYDYYEPILRICRDYGGRFHDTGGMAGSWNEWNTLMMCGSGLPVTAEAGNGAPNQREFQLFWGRWFTEGVNGVHYFQNWGEIAWNPEVLRTFEAALPMYHAIGKYHTPFAQVAALFSGLNDYLTEFPWTVEPDQSRGGDNSLYNSAAQLLNYCPRDGICGADFDTAVVDRYRVIIDTNTSYMKQELLDGIEKYVHRGGVFVTNGHTGRHTPTHPDSWPISKLTGYAVERVVGWGDGRMLSLADGQKVFSSSDLPPQTRAMGLALKPASTECIPLAVWDDGSVAIGMRKIGAGWIVHLSPLFRDARFVAIVGALLRRFGVTDRVPAFVTPQRGLHMRHFIGNSGMHDVWALFNESDVPIVTDLTFLPGVHPHALTDIVSGEHPAIVRDTGGDAVRGIELAKWQTRMFLSPRSDAIGSPLEWLKLQRAWWQGAVTPPAIPLPTPAEMQRFTLELTDGWAHRSVAELTDDQIAALTAPDIDDKAWERRTLGLYLAPGDLNPKRHLLRRRFTIPAHWSAGEIVMCADMPGAQFNFDTRTFVDGKAWANGRKQVDGPYFETFDGALKPGSTHVVALDIHGKSSLTGSRGPLWIYYLPYPQERQGLAGVWSAYSDPLHRTGEVQLPGTIEGQFLTRTATIDAAHKGRNVLIHLEASDNRFSIMINGRLINSAELLRGRSFSFNVTPMIEFGKENRIEIVTGGGRKTIHLIEVRYYQPGVYP